MRLWTECIIIRKKSNMYQYRNLLSRKLFIVCCFVKTVAVHIDYNAYF